MTRKRGNREDWLIFDAWVKHQLTCPPELRASFGEFIGVDPPDLRYEPKKQHPKKRKAEQ